MSHMVEGVPPLRLLLIGSPVSELQIKFVADSSMRVATFWRLKERGITSHHHTNKKEKKRQEGKERKGKMTKMTSLNRGPFPSHHPIVSFPDKH
jgi:hypothetical protein